MSFTYDKNLGDDRSKVRRMIADHRPANHLVEDEEIDGVLATATSNREAAATLAEQIVGRLIVDGHLDRAKLYQEHVAAKLRQGGGDINDSDWAGDFTGYCGDDAELFEVNQDTNGDRVSYPTEADYE